MRFLITGALQAHGRCAEILTNMGHSVDFLQNEKDVLPDKADCYDAVVCNGLFLHHPIENFINLKYIQLTSAGYDRVDLDYIKAHNIRVYNAGGVYSIPMAEFAVGGVLQLYKQSRFFYENQKGKSWNKHRGLLELSGKQVCIVGCGSVGGECAVRFSAFGCRVIGVDLYPKQKQGFEKVVGLDELDNELVKSDILVLTLPLTKESHHLINSSRLKKLKSGAVVVNIARGAVLATEALLNYLDRLGGAVLDVFEEEPLCKSSPLWKPEKVIVTPHNSFVSDNNTDRLLKLVLENLLNEQSNS